MANLSLTETMKFEKAGAMRRVKLILFKVLYNFLISQHVLLLRRGSGAEKPFTPEGSAVSTGIQALFPQPLLINTGTKLPFFERCC